MSIKIISAGAGSGKTFRLTKELTDSIINKTVRPNGIIATTFTNAAAAELKERVQSRLIDEKCIVEATEINQSLIGTVHSIGVSLMKRFAFEAGLSPFLDIIPADEEKAIFSRSLANVIDEATIEKMENFRNNFGMEPDEWKSSIRIIVDMARANNLDFNDLEKSSLLTWQIIANTLPEKNIVYDEQYHTQFRTILDATIQAVDLDIDTTKKTSDAKEALKKLLHQPDGYTPSWREYVFVSKLDVGTKSRDIAQPLKDFAEDHISCQAFQDDIKAYIEAVFQIAIQALEEYQRYKTHRALIDYTDMEVHLFNLLKNEAVRSVLREELDLLIVDEFQDTSPMQLAIFVLLSQIAKQAIWVGDTKQSIYSFRGADPKIMAQIIDWRGGILPEDIQEYSYRSRPLLVHSVNELFKKAFKEELPEEQIRLKPVRQDGDKPLEYPLLHWYFTSEQQNGKVNNNQLYLGLAHQLRAWVATQPNVEENNNIRPVEYGDVCILSRTNYHCLNIAEALSQAGIKAIVPRVGLMKTKEVQLLLSCIRVVNDSNDTLAVAELLLLVDNMDLEEVVKKRLLFLQENADSQSRYDWQTDSDFVRKVQQLRSVTQDLSVSELCQLLFEQLELKRIVAAWGNAEQRWANLNKMLFWTNQYEALTLKSYRAPTVNGFLTYFKKLHFEKGDEQATTQNRDAVRVMTYHKSKGLEWPVVICTALDNDVKVNVFEPKLEEENATLDIDDILANRWIRFFPNPYSKQFQNTEYVRLLETTETHQNKIRQAVREEARLLYVGLTRARDYQIFVSTNIGAKWLERVYGEPVLDAHSDSTPFYSDGEMITVRNSVINVESFENEEVGEQEEMPAVYFQPAVGVTNHPKRYHHHNDFTLSGSFSYGEKVEYNSALHLLTEEERNQLSTYWKDYFSAHVFHSDAALKQMIVQHLATRKEEVLPQHLVAILDTFYKNWSSIHPDAVFTRSFPIMEEIDHKIFKTEIDILIETEKEVFAFVNDYDSVFSKNSKKTDFILSYLPQCLPSYFPNKNCVIYLHFPVSGTYIRII